jgi:hypothetical protein
MTRNTGIRAKNMATEAPTLGKLRNTKLRLKSNGPQGKRIEMGGFLGRVFIWDVGCKNVPLPQSKVLVCLCLA